MRKTVVISIPEHETEVFETLKGIKERGTPLSYIMRRLLLRYRDNGYLFENKCDCEKGCVK